MDMHVMNTLELNLMCNIDNGENIPAWKHKFVILTHLIEYKQLGKQENPLFLALLVLKLDHSPDWNFTESFRILDYLSK
jgi:hypothetical protein